MKVRIVSVREKQFLVCFKCGLWGANNVHISKWEIGDVLIFKIGKYIVGTAEVTGESYMDDAVIWDNGLFWNRLPIQFNYMLQKEDYLSIDCGIKDLLINEWGKNYGWGILNKMPLEDGTTQFILNELGKKPNSMNYYKQYIDGLVEAIS